MSDLTDRLRGLYVTNGTNYVQEAADEIDKLRVTNKMLMDDKAALTADLDAEKLFSKQAMQTAQEVAAERDALRETQAKFGQVQHDLLSQIDALREQLTLAESVRAAQVAGLTEGAEKLREALREVIESPSVWDHYSIARAALKVEA